MIYLKGKKMGKGMKPKKGYNDKKYKDNYDTIDWSSHRNNKRQKEIEKEHKNEMYKYN